MDAPAPPAFQVGDRIRARHLSTMRGRIIELRGPLGPGGMQAYRVRVERKPKPAYVELTEDQIVLLPPKRPHGATAAPPASP